MRVSSDFVGRNVCHIARARRGTNRQCEHRIMEFPRLVTRSTTSAAGHRVLSRGGGGAERRTGDGASHMQGLYRQISHDPSLQIRYYRQFTVRIEQECAETRIH